MTWYVDRNDMFVYQIFKIFGSRLRGQRSRGPYGGSNFQNGNFAILIADSKSLQKSVNVKCFSFFDIFIRTWSKMRSKAKIALLLSFDFKTHYTVQVLTSFQWEECQIVQSKKVTRFQASLVTV